MSIRKVCLSVDGETLFLGEYIWLVWGWGRGKRARIGRVAAVFPIKIQGKPFSHGCAFLIHRDGGICGNVEPRGAAGFL